MMKTLLSSFFLLYFQITSHPSYAIDSATETRTSDDSIDANQHLNTVNKFSHILDAESPEKLKSSDVRLQEEIATLHEPDFVLIGVVKSGSTSLYHYMVQHPQITGVESTYLLPESMRDHISSIIRKRKAGKLPKISRPSPKRGYDPITKSTVITPGKHIKENIFEINNFDLARMMKPIIDQKEVRFFDSFWYNHLQTITNHSLLTAWKWYLQTFNQDTSPPDTHLLRGEASPTYFASSQFTAERIKLWLPNIKLILLLRNPVRRFVSHLKMIKENHSSNMRFRRDRREQFLKSQKNKTLNQDMRRLLEDMDQMDQMMGGYNPFNNGNNMQQRMGYKKQPFVPQTRYGRARVKDKRNPMKKLMRTRGGRYGTSPRDRKDYRLDEEVMGHEDDEYINEEATMYEEQRQSMRGLPFKPPQGKGGNPKKRPINKMEKIIGSIYKMSMYQVILVSNANPNSQAFYSKRWGIGRDVTGFINRLLFGGIYTMRMKEWLKRFDDKHLFYRESGELFDDPVRLMKELEVFLGVTAYGDDNWSNITTQVYNVELEKGKGYQHKVQDVQQIEHWDIDVEKKTLIVRPDEKRNWLSQEIIALLKDYYRPHNGELSELFDGVKYKNWDY